MKSATVRGFSKRRLAMLDQTKMVGIRSGRTHRFTFVWIVVVDDRAFIRSWNDKPTGWFRAFAEEPVGTLKLGDREVAIRSRKARGARLMTAIESAYSAKYVTPASLDYVRGFKTARRRNATAEITPR